MAHVCNACKCKKRSITYTGDLVSDLMNALIMEHGHTIQLYSTDMFHAALKKAGLRLAYIPSAGGPPSGL